MNVPFDSVHAVILANIDMNAILFPKCWQRFFLDDWDFKHGKAQA